MVGKQCVVTFRSNEKAHFFKWRLQILLQQQKQNKNITVQLNQLLLGSLFPLHIQRLFKFQLPITFLAGSYSPGDLAYNPQFSYHYQGGLKVLDITNFVTHDFIKIGLGYRAVRYPFDLRNNNQAVYYMGINKIVDEKFFLQIMYSYDQSLDKLATAVGATNEISICVYFSNFGKGQSPGIDRRCTEFVKAGNLQLVTFPENKMSDFNNRSLINWLKKANRNRTFHKRNKRDRIKNRIN